MSTLRVLHLPVNTASIPSHTVRGLRAIGVDAQGLICVNSPVQSSDGLKVMQFPSLRKPHLRIFRSFQWVYYYFKWIAWADVIHWYFGTPALPLGFDLRYFKAMRKPGLIEWLGSEIRVPEIEFSDNPYYAAVFHNGYEHHRMESLKRSRRLQSRFAMAGFASMASTVMLQHVHKDILPRSYTLPGRVVVEDYQPLYPVPGRDCPLIVHAPTAPIAKGTPSVLKTIKELRKKYKFEFRLIQGLPRREALYLMQRADIFLDQFVIGYHGMAALEAMALGKPTLCYIKPSAIGKYPTDFPIVNASPDDLAEVLEPLLKDGELRSEIGRKSRAYVEKYHDATKVAHQLVDIYQEVIKERRRRSSLCI